eukprot:17156_1
MSTSLCQDIYTIYQDHSDIAIFNFDIASLDIDNTEFLSWRNIDLLVNNAVNITFPLQIDTQLDLTGLPKSILVITADNSNDDPCENIYGGGWRLVRHSYDAWHPSLDNLQGTDSYGDPDNNPKSMNTWSIPFDLDLQADGSSLFMFSNGDCSEWMVAENKQFTTTFVSETERNILASHVSSTQYEALWWLRPTNAEDPWISYYDHDLYSYTSLLYGEAGTIWRRERFDAPGADKSVNVWIKNINQLYPIQVQLKEYAGSLHLNVVSNKASNSFLSNLSLAIDTKYNITIHYSQCIWKLSISSIISDSVETFQFQCPVSPTAAPTTTINPTQIPSFLPSKTPTNPTITPTFIPTMEPIPPSIQPTLEPTVEPTIQTDNPTLQPTAEPTTEPTKLPSSNPTTNPTQKPTQTETYDIYFYTKATNIESTQALEIQQISISDLPNMTSFQSTAVENYVLVSFPINMTEINGTDSSNQIILCIAQ